MFLKPVNKFGIEDIVNPFFDGNEVLKAKYSSLYKIPQVFSSESLVDLETLCSTWSLLSLEFEEILLSSLLTRVRSDVLDIYFDWHKVLDRDMKDLQDFGISSKIARLDGYMTSKGFKFLEFNSLFPGGMFYQDFAEEHFLKSLKDDGKNLRRISRGEAIGNLLDSEFENFCRLKGRSFEQNLLIISPDDRGTIRECNFLNEVFKKSGFKPIVITDGEISNLSMSNGGLYLGNEEISLVLKRVIDYNSTLFNLSKNKNISLVNSWSSYVMNDKGLFVLLNDENVKKLFSTKVQSFIDNYIPVTKSVKDLRVNGDISDVLKNKDSYVLKLQDSYGGNGVVVGRGVLEEDWQRYLDSCEGVGSIVQEYFEPSRTFLGHRHDLNVVVAGGKFAGLTSRVMIDDKTYKSNVSNSSVNSLIFFE